MQTDKPRVVKDYDKLDQAIQEQIKLAYPHGFSTSLIKFKNREGNMVSALPFEADDKYYLVRMTISEARQIIEDDEDYDDLGYLKEDAKEEYEDKHVNIEELADQLEDGGDEDEE